MDVKHASGLATTVLAAAALGLAACGGGNTPTAPTPSNGAPSSAPGPSSTPGSSGSSGTTAATPTGRDISKSKARKLATDKYGGQVISVESDHAENRATWEVEIKNSRQGRIEVDVAKDNGDIVAMEHDNG
jgi:hypothetical protein